MWALSGMGDLESTPQVREELLWTPEKHSRYLVNVCYFLLVDSHQTHCALTLLQEERTDEGGARVGRNSSYFDVLCLHLICWDSLIVGFTLYKNIRFYSLWENFGDVLLPEFDEQSLKTQTECIGSLRTFNPILETLLLVPHYENSELYWICMLCALL